ncbi:hypothetical protein GR160_02955 [Flavobacterium sp. Sd200]|uniref:hypothetical protein n=1 Tax=Flavobacterium sp. Sd200 TaxID=2692211 RepID=UPI00136A21FD|nr:hypothetical protein [Flavobacterium sp. Sd200]MXN90173.1 hypothetical protein [Flavobacterium sp. Sd200]
MPKTEPIYKQQGNRFYKIVGFDMLEIDYSNAEHGIMSISYADTRTSPIAPNGHAKIYLRTLLISFLKRL